MKIQALLIVVSLLAGALWQSAAVGQDSARLLTPALEAEVQALLGEIDAAGEGQQKQSLLLQLKAGIDERVLSDLYGHFGQVGPAPVDADAPVAPGTAIIYPVPLPGRLRSLVQTQEALAIFAAEVDRERLRQAASNLRVEMQIVGGSFGAMDTQSRQLYDWIVAPAVAYLRASDIERLVFVSVPELRSLPLAALFDGRRYLIEEFEVAMSFGAPAPGSELRASLQAGLFAGITEAVHGFAARPGTADELQSIAGSFAGAQLLDSQFTADSLGSRITDPNVDFLHLATAAEFEASPDDSSLLAYDGLVALAALRELLLAREQALSLLTLSASSTPRRDQQAVLSLLGLGVVTGVENTVTGLWQVNHQATAVLMAEFYSGLDGGEPPGEALRSAQLQQLRSPRFSHPSFWAAFQLVLNPAR